MKIDKRLSSLFNDGGRHVNNKKNISIYTILQIKDT